jgi:hypothetical protein
VRLDLLRADGAVVAVDLGSLSGTGSRTFRAAVPCASGCRLRAVRLLRTRGDGSAAGLDLTVQRLVADGRPVDLRPADGGWQGLSTLHAPTVGAAAGALRFSARTVGSDLTIQRTDAPVLVPALASGRLSPPASTPLPTVDPAGQVTAADLTGLQAAFQVVGHLAAVPSRTGPTAVVPLDLAGQLTGPVGARTVSQVWLAADDPGREGALVTALRRRGVDVSGRRTAAQAADDLGARGPALALRLADLVGVAALLLATIVLAVSVATSGRVRAQDLAGLRAVGVPRGVLTGAVVREQLAVVVVAVLAGTVLGLAGAAVSVTRVPVAAGLPRPEVTAIGWAPVLAAAACLLLLGGQSWLLGRGLAGRVDVGLLREGAR